MKKTVLYMRCCDCDKTTERSKMFIKIFNTTEIWLCKECAMKLKDEIKEYGAGGEKI